MWQTQDGPLPTPRSLGWTWLGPCVAFLLIALILGLWFLGLEQAYRAVLRVFGVEAGPFPFFDVHAITSAIECARAGVDVIAANPCDAGARPHTYSPLWLRAAALPVTRAWSLPAGMVLVMAFLASLFLLPWPRDLFSIVVGVAAMASSAVVFALERANNDLLVFALVAGALWTGHAGLALRMLGYAGLVAAGLLKFYPLTALVLLARERLPVALAVGMACLLVVALAFVPVADDTLRAMRNIPANIFATDAFGAANAVRGVPVGLAHYGVQLPWLGPVLMAGLLVYALSISVRLGRGWRIAEDVQVLPTAERDGLLAGGVLVAACFLTAHNIYYRAILLLLLLPGLLRLARIAKGRAERPIYVAAIGVILFLLWSPAIRMPLAENSGGWIVGVVLGSFDVAREAAWWWLTALLGILAWSALRTMPAWRDLFLTQH